MKQKILAIGAILIVLSACEDKKKPQAPPPIEPTGGTVGCEIFFNNTNANAVQNGALNPRFALTKEDPSELCAIETYHWNGGAGKVPGKKDFILLINKTTNVKYGPWPVTATAGQGGAKNVNWQALVIPRIELKPGDYEVIDSDPPSWSWNATSLDKDQPPKAAGFAKVWLAHTQ